MLGQKLGNQFKPYYAHTRGHSFDPKFMKLFRNVNPYEI